MNIDECGGLINLAMDELSDAQILFDACKYRGSIIHSYYAIFDSAKVLLLTKGLTSKKHDNTLKQFSKEFIHKNIFSHDIYQYYADAKNGRKRSSYDFQLVLTRLELKNTSIMLNYLLIKLKNIILNLLKINLICEF